jgi:hypothetical protein
MAKKSLTTQQAAQAMAEAHTDMNLFAAVERLMEGGLVSSDAQPDDFKIIKAAQDAGRRAFRRYEAAQAVLAIKPV